MDPIWIKFALFVSILTNLGFWLFLFVKLLFQHNSQKISSSGESVSLIVCIKDGISHISNVNRYLNVLRPTDELVLVDDFSTDKTLESLKRLNDKRAIIVSAKVDQKGKKKALEEGIGNAKKEIILLTDIDCIPRSNDWINAMTDAFTEKKDIVLGYGAYKKEKGLLNAFIRHETLMTAMQYMSYALSGFPYMGVGRNLAYKKEVFINSNGFDSHVDIASGDDDLFISEVANVKNTTVCLNPHSFTESIPAQSMRAFFNQKTRHVTTASRYKWGIKVLLTIYSMSHILTYVLTLLLIFLGAYSFALVTFGLRMAICWMVYAKIAIKYEEEDLKLSFPLLDGIMFLYYILLSPFLFIHRKQW